MIKDREEEIIGLYKQGMSVINIAKQFQCSREAVYTYLRRLPNFKSVSKRLYKKKQRERDLVIRKKIMSGKIFSPQSFSFKAGARHFKTSQQLLHRIVKGTKYDVSQKGKAERDKIIHSLYKEGMTQLELAKLFKLSQARISYILEKFKND